MWEPIDTNPLTNTVKKFVKTEKHEEQERAFSPNELLGKIREHFEIKSVKYYWLFSYLLPFITARMPFKPIWRSFALILSEIDHLLLSYLHFTRRFAGGIEIIACKGEKQ